MANTFKFGNGNWAVKKDSVLAYNDENNNFKPLPFDFTRDTIGTYVDSDGLIKTVASGEARIDYLGNTNGHLLLEPSRTNLVTNTTDFFVTGWGGTRVTEGSTTISPDGSYSAHKLVATTDNNTHYRHFEKSSASAGTYAGSCFFKKGEHTVASLAVWADSGADRFTVYVDLNNGSFIESHLYNSPTGTSYKIEDYGSGWYRVSATITHTSGYVRVIPTTSPTGYVVSGSDLPSFTGDATSGGYAWGAQLEEGSYATSYIPTNGSSVTRAADSSSQTPPSGIIGQTEGTVYVEFDYLNSTGERRFIFQLTSGSGEIYARIESGQTLTSQILNSGSGLTSQNTAVPSGTNKLAIAYASNDAVIYLNGTQIAVTSSITIPSLSNFYIGSNSNGTQQISGINKEFKLYNTRLSNAELITLTT